MNSTSKYIVDRVTIGWAMLIGGALLFVTGLALQTLFKVPFNARIISGAGLFVNAVGIAQVVRYTAARKNRAAAARVINEERDERNRMIRERAAARGFWISIALTYVALMWLSFSANGSLPAPSSEAQWYFLAAAVVIPFAVYIGSVVYDQNNH